MNCPLCGHDNLPGSDTCEVCQADLASVDAEAFRGRLARGPLGDPLGSLGPQEPGVLSPQDSVAAALPLMRADLRGSILLCEKDQVVGIFTENDLLRRVPQGSDLSRIKLGSVMTPEPFTYSRKDSVAYALNGMTAWGNRHLPVRGDDDGIPSLMSVREVLRHLKEKCVDGEA
jgi:CBS domain-containing protein